jgi:two-component system response regulator
MNEKTVEILLVEDNPDDEMLAMYAFKRHNLADKIHVVRDGAEALDYLFCTGAYAERHLENPRVILLDKKLPLVDGMEVLRRVQ